MEHILLFVGSVLVRTAALRCFKGTKMETTRIKSSCVTLHRNFMHYTLQFAMQIFPWYCIIFKHFYDEYNGDTYLVYFDVPHTLVGNGTSFT